MAKLTRKKVGECQIEIREVNGRVTFKCKRIKRIPTAEEIIESVRNDHIIFK